ncbi:MAG: polyprenyl synthetase family protein [Bacteroidetes bacterium]|nr:polyprenyl synthetase family protein [Bacteroidota bacterium]
MYNQADLKNLVDKAIINLSYNSEAVRLIDPIKYVLSIGGKRLRPVLSLLACNLFNDQIDEAVMPATGIEVFHNFTLVHDDIIDNAPVRRNFPTVHNKWNVNQAILSGDVMAFISNECFLQSPPRCMVKVFREYNKAAIEVCTGQQLDIDFEKAMIVSENEYLRMIELKTAVLIAAAVKIGAIIGGAEEKDTEIMYEFGRNIGLAFQIQDDLLDIYGDIKLFGKVTGGDIVENKKTFLSVKAFELSKGKQFKMLQDLFSDRERDPVKKVSSVMEIYGNLNIKMLTENLANEYIEKAFTMLEKVDAPRERKKELTLAASSLIGRVQ